MFHLHSGLFQFFFQTIVRTVKCHLNCNPPTKLMLSSTQYFKGSFFSQNTNIVSTYVNAVSTYNYFLFSLGLQALSRFTYSVMPMIPVNNAISGSCSVSISVGLNLKKTNIFLFLFFFYIFVHFFSPSSRERNASFAETLASKTTQIVLSTVIILSAGRKIAGTIQAWSGTISSFWVWSQPQRQPVQELPNDEKNSSCSPLNHDFLRQKLLMRPTVMAKYQCCAVRRSIESWESCMMDWSWPC